MKENRLKRLLREPRPAYGLWSAFGSAAVVEALSQSTADWILLDAEHGIPSYEDCFPLLQACSAGEATVLVRVPSSGSLAIRRVLDMGAEGVIVPYVKTADEVEQVVSASRYPPAGSRGIGPFRASRYYVDFREYYERANDEVVVVVQIETREAVDNLESILGVPGLDAVLIGPADLSAALGEFPATDGPAMRETVETILSSARKAGKPVGYYCNSGKEARQRAAEGFLMLSVALDIGILTRGASGELRDARRTD